MFCYVTIIQYNTIQSNVMYCIVLYYIILLLNTAFYMKICNFNLVKLKVVKFLLFAIQVLGYKTYGGA